MTAPKTLEQIMTGLYSFPDSLSKRNLPNPLLNKAMLAFMGLSVVLSVTAGCNSTPAAGPAPVVTGSPSANTEPASANTYGGSDTPALMPVSADTGGAAAGMQRVSLADPGVGMQNAMSMNIPSGWTFQGGIIRTVSCSPGDAFPQLQVSSPDGAYSFSVMTPFFTTATPTNFNLQGCGAVAPLASSADILSRYVVPGLSRSGTASAPATAPGAAAFTQANSRSSNGITTSADAARVHVSYSNGTEEYIEGHTLTSRMQGVPGGTTATTVLVYKAPAGQLDAFYQRATTTMLVTPNPQWQQRNQQLQQQATMRAQQQGQQQRATIMQNGQDAGAAGRAMLAQTRNQIAATGQASMNAAAASEAARHTGAVGTANYVGNRPTSTYFFCNASGGRTTNNNPNAPGPGWYRCN
jgi:hypothetical protein